MALSGGSRGLYYSLLDSSQAISNLVLCWRVLKNDQLESLLLAEPKSGF
jgi:hypothetical protein